MSLNDSVLEGDSDFFRHLHIKEKKIMSYTTETNVVICKNLQSDCSTWLQKKIHEARGALEAMIKMGCYPPGEYVISRKGLKGNQAVDWTSTKKWGHTYRSAVKANAAPKRRRRPNWGGVALLRLAALTPQARPSWPLCRSPDRRLSSTGAPCRGRQTRAA